MMKKYIFIILIIMVLLCSCDKDDKNIEITYEIENTSKDIMQEEDIIYVDPFNSYSELRQRYIGDIEIPAYAGLTDMCIYGDTIYYSIDYHEALMSDVVIAEDNYISKIYEYNAKTNKYHILYEAEGRISRLWNISTNGKKLVWIEKEEDTTVIYVMDIEEGYGEQIYRSKDSFHKIAVTDKYILWMDDGSNIKNSKSVYRYDFDMKSTVEIIKGISIFSSDNIECYDNRVTIYENNDETSVVAVYDFEGNRIYRFCSDGQICEAVSNSRMCVWVNKKIESEDYEIIIYDIYTDKKYSLQKEWYESIVLKDNHLVMTMNDEVLSYSLGDNKEKCITAPDNIGLTKVIYSDTYGNVSYVHNDVTGGIFYDKSTISVYTIM